MAEKVINFETAKMMAERFQRENKVGLQDSADKMQAIIDSQKVESRSRQ
jgi:hypothetical protein